MNADFPNKPRSVNWLHASDRNVQLIEVAVLLFLIAPSMGLSFFLVNQVQLSFTTMAISSILSDLALVSLVFYLIWRNGETRRQIGWNFKNAGREVIWGLLLFAPVSLTTTLLVNVLHAAGLSAPTNPPSFFFATGPFQVMLACLLVSVVAVSEETIFRGYLLLRFTAVTGRRSVAVLLSATIFSLGHGYEGMAGLFTVFFLGVTLALVYLWRQSLIASVMMHFLIDFTSILLRMPPPLG